MKWVIAKVLTFSFYHCCHIICAYDMLLSLLTAMTFSDADKTEVV